MPRCQVVCDIDSLPDPSAIFFFSKTISPICFLRLDTTTGLSRLVVFFPDWLVRFWTLPEVFTSCQFSFTSIFFRLSKKLEDIVTKCPVGFAGSPSWCREFKVSNRRTKNVKRKGRSSKEMNSTKRSLIAKTRCASIDPAVSRSSSA